MSQRSLIIPKDFPQEWYLYSSVNYVGPPLTNERLKSVCVCVCVSSLIIVADVQMWMGKAVGTCTSPSFACESLLPATVLSIEMGYLQCQQNVFRSFVVTACQMPNNVRGFACSELFLPAPPSWYFCEGESEGYSITMTKPVLRITFPKIDPAPAKLTYVRHDKLFGAHHYLYSRFTFTSIVQFRFVLWK